MAPLAPPIPLALRVTLAPQAPLAPQVPLALRVTLAPQTPLALRLITIEADQDNMTFTIASNENINSYIRETCDTPGALEVDEQDEKDDVKEEEEEDEQKTDPIPLVIHTVASEEAACQTDPFPTGLESCNTACQTDPVLTITNAPIEGATSQCDTPGALEVDEQDEKDDVKEEEEEDEQKTDPIPLVIHTVASEEAACQTDAFPTGLESCNTSCQTDPFPTGLESCNTACQTDPFPTGLESCNTACQTDPVLTITNAPIEGATSQCDTPGALEVDEQDEKDDVKEEEEEDEQKWQPKKSSAPRSWCCVCQKYKTKILRHLRSIHDLKGEGLAKKREECRVATRERALAEREPPKHGRTVVCPICHVPNTNLSRHLKNVHDIDRASPRLKELLLFAELMRTNGKTETPSVSATASSPGLVPNGVTGPSRAHDQIEFNLAPKAFILNLISELGSPRPDSVKRMHHFRPPVLRDVAMRISYKLFEIERFCRLIENAGYKFKKDVSWRGNAVVEEDESLESLQKLELARNRAGKTKSARPTCRSSIVVHTPEGRISREIEIIWWTDLYEDTDIAKLFLLTKYFSIKLFVFQLTILFLYSF
ncbi:predicted protein [Nematostella vectensis]|uniref:Uncharacterized protein n=1 Tax=Nematostella vectensis TaxID=45351 RepID=A7SN47_NEMVE|nr:predicted protein [Nematostella vectensis]|eukprot:XP_001626952.1 predicted protein [Nematostella vectensis]